MEIALGQVQKGEGVGGIQGGVGLVEGQGLPDGLGALLGVVQIEGVFDQIPQRPAGVRGVHRLFAQPEGRFAPVLPAGVGGNGPGPGHQIGVALDLPGLSALQAELHEILPPPQIGPEALRERLGQRGVGDVLIAEGIALPVVPGDDAGALHPAQPGDDPVQEAGRGGALGLLCRLRYTGGVIPVLLQPGPELQSHLPLGVKRLQRVQRPGDALPRGGLDPFTGQQPPDHRLQPGRALCRQAVVEGAQSGGVPGPLHSGGQNGVQVLQPALLRLQQGQGRVHSGREKVLPLPAHQGRLAEQPSGQEHLRVAQSIAAQQIAAQPHGPLRPRVALVIALQQDLAGLSGRPGGLLPVVVFDPVLEAVKGAAQFFALLLGQLLKGLLDERIPGVQGVLRGLPGRRNPSRPSLRGGGGWADGRRGGGCGCAPRRAGSDHQAADQGVLEGELLPPVRLDLQVLFKVVVQDGPRELWLSVVL